MFDLLLTNECSDDIVLLEYLFGMIVRCKLHLFEPSEVYWTHSTIQLIYQIKSRLSTISITVLNPMIFRKSY